MIVETTIFNWEDIQNLRVFFLFIFFPFYNSIHLHYRHIYGILRSSILFKSSITFCHKSHSCLHMHPYFHSRSLTLHIFEHSPICTSILSPSPFLTFVQTSSIQLAIHNISTFIAANKTSKNLNIQKGKTVFFKAL